MTRSSRSHRPFLATLILALLIAAFPVSPASAVTRTDTRYTYTSKKICPIDWKQSTRMVKKLIRCAADYYGVNVDMALYVAKRESTFDPRAYNEATCAKGIYQHLCKYWPDRAYKYGFKGRSAYNGRANIIVTMKMVRKYGWGAWGF